MDQVQFTWDEVRRATGGEWIGAFNPDNTVGAIFTDTRETVQKGLFIAFSGEKFDAHDFLDKAVAQGAVLLCVEASKKDRVPADVSAIAVENTVSAYQALAHFHRMRFPDLHLLALTGSCGKTSTKETVRAILEAAYGKEHILATEGNTNNQIGVPRNLLRLTSAHQAAIIEMGTNHPGEIEPLAKCAMPESAMIVSIGNCHLEFLGSLEGVAREKSHIFKFLPENGHAALPLGAAGFDIMKQASAHVSTRTFGTVPEADFRAEYKGGNLHGSSFLLTKRATGEQALIQWNIPGAHQACNAAGAAALADSLGIPFAKIAEGIANTTLPGMRMRIAEHGGATWINDAYNANPDSMCASLQWLAEFADASKLVLALGDMGELGENSAAGHERVLQTARKLFPVARIFTAGSKMKQAAEKCGIHAERTYADSTEAAAEFASLIRPGELVFLKASRSTAMEKLEPKDEAK